MRIVIESEPGYSGRAMAAHVAARIRTVCPEAEVVIVTPMGPRLPANYSAMAERDYGVRQMQRME